MGHDRIARKRVLRGASLMLAAGGYVRVARPRMARWGAADGEVRDAMPGDGEVPEPQFAVTRAVTIAAPPDAVWPWIVQIGYHRAGWYAYDLFDNDDIPSAETILPEFQHLEIGQVIGEEGFAVREIEPSRHLVLAFHYPKTEWVVKQGVWPKFGHCSMCLQLRPVHDGERTRLLYRVRLSAPALGRGLMAALFEPADFVASRKMLTGIKRRAETHDASAFAAEAHKTKAGGMAR
jgi:uncharacterized protein YndB with AHSA1/START domain